MYYIYICVCLCVWWLQDCRREHTVALPTPALQVLSSRLKVTFYWPGHVRWHTAQRRGPRCGRYAGHQRCHLNARDIMGWERSETCATCVLFLMWCIGVLYSSIGVGFFGQPEVRSGIFRSYMSKAIIRAPLMRWFGQAQGKLWSQCSAREIGALVCFTWIREPGADGVTFVNRRSMIARLARRSMTKSGLFACEF